MVLDGIPTSDIVNFVSYAGEVGMHLGAGNTMFDSQDPEPGYCVVYVC